MARLKYIKNNQDIMRADSYHCSYDDIDQEDSEMSSSTRVVLPSTFTGGARYMHQQMLDSMALVQKFGKPHFFISMTCNSNWKEIQEQLDYRQTSLDQADICCRVFNKKRNR